MKQKNKLIAMLIGITMATTSIAQNITGSGTNNTVLKFTATGSTAGNSQITDNGTNIGINDPTPSFKLDINGATRIASTNSLYLNGQTDLNNDGIRIFHNGAGASGYFDCRTGVGLNFRVDNNNGGTTRMTILNTGEVGIGTTSPGKKLDVNGDINIANTSAYYINGSTNKVLWHNGTTTNLFVGVGAGTTNSITESTFIGYNAGKNTSATTNQNTFVGHKAGESNTSGSFNTFLGSQAGANNYTGGSNVIIGYGAGNCPTCTTNTADYNVFVGAHAGEKNTSDGNIFIGYNSGVFNVAGTNNVFVGYFAGHNSADGDRNSFFGNYAGQSTTSDANDNTFLGNYAGQANTLGDGNTRVGSYAGQTGTGASNNTESGYYANYFNVSGNNNTIYGYEAGKGASGNSQSDNTFIGYRAGYGAIGAGSRNTAVGYSAGATITNKPENTCLGYGADVSTAFITQASAIGWNTVVTGSQKIFLGDAGALGCYNAANVWAAQSDQRFKINVQENVKGLDFIKRLRPVTYKMDTKALAEYMMSSMSDSIRVARMNGVDYTVSTNRIHSGFLAQEVEIAMSQSGFTSTTIVHPPTNSTDPYALNYVEIVVPLVKALQELNSTVETLQAQVTALSGGGQRTNDTQGKTETTLQLELANKGDAMLYQNEPNPFDGATTICKLPL